MQKLIAEDAAFPTQTTDRIEGEVTQFQVGGFTKHEYIAVHAFISVLQNPGLIAAIIAEAGVMTKENVNAAIVKESINLADTFINAYNSRTEKPSTNIIQ